jgi:hypothetical protein
MLRSKHFDHVYTSVYKHIQYMTIAAVYDRGLIYYQPDAFARKHSHDYVNPFSPQLERFVADGESI